MWGIYSPGPTFSIGSGDCIYYLEFTQATFGTNRIMCSEQRSTAVTPLWHSRDEDRCIQIDLPYSMSVGMVGKRRGGGRYKKGEGGKFPMGAQ